MHMGFPRLTSTWIQFRITDHCPFRCRKSGPAATPGSSRFHSEAKKLKETFDMKARAHNARRLCTDLAILIGASGITLAQNSQIAPGSEQPRYAVIKPTLQQPQTQ